MANTIFETVNARRQAMTQEEKKRALNLQALAAINTLEKRKSTPSTPATAKGAMSLETTAATAQLAIAKKQEEKRKAATPAPQLAMPTLPAMNAIGTDADIKRRAVESMGSRMARPAIEDEEILRMAREDPAKLTEALRRTYEQNNRMDELYKEVYPNSGVINTATGMGRGAVIGATKQAPAGLMGAATAAHEGLGSFWNMITTPAKNGEINYEDYISPLRDDAQRMKAEADRLSAENLAGRAPGAQRLVGVSQAAGNMLPAAALGGVGAAAGLTGLTTALVGAGAGGSSYIDAVTKGAGVGEAAAYGTLVGATEAFTERLFGGNPLLDTKPGLVNQLIKKVGGSDKLMRYLASKPVEMVNEGMEEAVATIMEPVFQRLTYDPNASMATLEEIMDSAIDGVLLSGMLQGGAAAINSAKNIGTKKPTEAPTAPAITEANVPAETEGNNFAPRTEAEVKRESASTTEAPEIKPAEPAKPATNAEAKQIMDDPAAMQELGIDTNGKTASQVRAEIKDKLNEIRQQRVEQQQTEQATMEEEPVEAAKQEARTTPEGMGAASYGFDPFSNLANKYGTIPEGENPARVVDVPKQTSDTENVSRTARTAMEAEATPEGLLDDIAEAVVRGDFSYVPIKNDDINKAAVQTIEKKGYQNAYTDWVQRMESGRSTAEDIALGWNLYNQAGNAAAADRRAGGTGEEATKTAIRIASIIANDQRNSGQKVQAQRLLKTFSPAHQLYEAEYAVEKINESLTKKAKKKHAKKSAATAAKIETEAVNDARKDAATEIKTVYTKHRRRGGGQKVEGNAAGEPFTFEYAEKVGEAVAKGLESSLRPKKQQTYLKQLAAQIKRFAMEKVPTSGEKKAPITAIDLLRDYVQNEAFYREAWEAAQLEIGNNGPVRSELINFVNSGIGVDASTNPQNAIFMKALVKAAAESGETKSILNKQSALGFTGMSENIANYLIEQTGAEGEMAQTMRDAAASYVNDVLAESDNDANTDIDNAIKSAMTDIGVTLSDIVVKSEAAKLSARDAIVDKLVKKYGFGQAEATNVADTVNEHFRKLCETKARRLLDVRFKDRQVERKSDVQRLEEYARLGAFDIGSQYNEAAIGKIIGEDEGVTLDPVLAAEFLAAEDDAARDAAMDKIYDSIADQMPFSVWERLKAWRYVAMLGNLKTQDKNISGNAVHFGARTIKNVLNATIEGAVAKADPNFKRTRALLNPVGDAALIGEAWKLYNTYANMILDGGKYSDYTNGRANNIVTEIRRRREKKVFDDGLWQIAKPLRSATNWAMDKGDVIFAKTSFTGALASWLKANGYTAKDIADGKVSSTAMDEAIAFAVGEAQEAVFRDETALGNWLEGLKVREGKTAGKRLFKGILNTGLDANLAFRRTPANVATRAYEYSPGNALNVGVKLLELRDGDITPNEFIDAVTKTLTGSGLTVLGVILAKQGILHASSGDDEKEAEFAATQGRQAYSIDIGDRNYTLEWAAPMSIPLFVGAELWQQMVDRDPEGGMTLSGALKAAEGLFAPMEEMSMISGIADTLGNIEKDNFLGSIAENSIKNMVSQYMPTAAGQIERVLEGGERRQTYVDRNSEWWNSAQKGWATILNKAPGEYNQIPYIDAWGRREKTGDMKTTAGENFVLPWYSKKLNTTEVDEQLQELYDEGYTGVLPKEAPKDTRVNGEYFDGEQYTEYAEKRGQKSYKLVDKVLDFGDRLDGAEKEAAIQKVYDFATQYGKAAVSDYEMEDWAKKYSGKSDAEIADAIVFKTLETMYGSGDRLISELRDAGVKADTIMAAQSDNRRKVWNEQGKASGLSVYDALDVQYVAAETKSDDNMTKKEKMVQYIDSKPISKEQKTALYLYLDYSEKQMPRWS